MPFQYFLQIDLIKKIEIANSLYIQSIKIDSTLHLVLNSNISPQSLFNRYEFFFKHAKSI
jgi:hypothetical protein